MKKDIAILLLFTLMGFACNKYSIDNVQVLPWEVDIAIPLINSTFSVNDIFEIGDNSSLEYINVDEGLLGITYSGSIFSYDAKDIIEVGDQQFENSISFPDPGLPTGFTDTIYSSEIYTMDFETQNLDGIEARYLKMLSGTLDIIASSEIAYLSQIQVTIPHMKKNGVSYQFTSPIQAGETVSDQEELVAYNLDLSQEDLGFNQLRIEYRLIVEYDPSITSTGENVSISIHFNEPTLDYVIGFFGNNQLANQNDTIKIELFNNTVSGHFQFLDPFMEVNFINSFGFPTEIDITQFKSVNQVSGEVTPLNLEGLTDQPFELSYPLQIGDSTLDQYFFDNSNSNIEVILNDADKYVIWGLEASSNPNGPGSTFNFLSHDSKMLATTNLTIPLKGYAWDWVFSDTTLLEEGIDIEDPEELSNLTLRLILNNGFPAEGYVQIYTLDSTNAITDSLFDTPTMLLESGVIVNGIVTEATKTITDIELDDDKKEHFIHANKLITNAKMQTTNGSEMEVIQIYDYYSIDVMMGVRANVLIEP